MALEQTIRERLETQPLLLMTHLICGYPDWEANETMLRVMDEAGVALVELQFPFSEPTADGPAFCRANQLSIERGTKPSDCFDLMRRTADEKSFTPLMMGYYNTVFKMGHADFCRRLGEAGGGGFILPDLPPEEADGLMAEADARNLDFVHLMTPTSSDERLRLIASKGRGFFYCVARRGVTGARTDFGAELDEFIGRCRRVTELPLAVGFGVATPEDIQSLKGKADVAVVGTAALKAWEEGGEPTFRSLIGGLAEAARR